jgi:acyl-CoA reductase-like NAD-dependent aldehyde dehydrogenase
MFKHMLINGEWTMGRASEVIAVEDPATQEVLGEVPRGTPADAGSAVAAAAVAFDGWRRMPANERATLLHEAASRIRAHHAELVRLLTLEQGKPVTENVEELDWTTTTFDYYAELARHERGRVLPSAEASQLNLVLKESYGVAACIVPWNYPLLLLAWKAAPALAAGNSLVIKPSEHTPLATLYLAEHCLSHLPPGVVNVVTGYGPEAGEALVTHPHVALVAFTGSLATGQHIARLAGPMMKKLHLELGGKDALVVADDADPEVAARAVAYAALLNAGQVCTSAERVYLPQSRAAQFTEALVEHVRGLRLGPGIQPGTDIGPLKAEAFRRKVEQHVADAVAQGATALTGGRRPAHLERGYFYEPTVLTGVDHSMLIMHDETFGPTIPLMAYRSFDEAIALVNDSPYGLGASLISRDPLKAKQFFEEVRAGTVWINDPLTDNYAGPFGGMKLSGNARELGREGLESFQDTKHVHWDFAMQNKSYWYPYD